MVVWADKHRLRLSPEQPDQNSQLAKDYERLVETGEMLLYLAMSRILLRRLTRKHER